MQTSLRRISHICLPSVRSGILRLFLQVSKSGHLHYSSNETNRRGISRKQVHEEERRLDRFLDNHRELFNRCYTSILARSRAIVNETESTDLGEVCGDFIYFQRMDSHSKGLQIFRRSVVEETTEHAAVAGELVLDLSALLSYYHSSGASISTNTIATATANATATISPSAMTLIATKPSNCGRLVAFLIEVIDSTSQGIDSGDASSGTSTRTVVFIRDMDISQACTVTSTGNGNIRLWELQVMTSHPLSHHQYISDLEWQPSMSASEVASPNIVPDLFLVASCHEFHRSRSIYRVKLSSSSSSLHSKATACDTANLFIQKKARRQKKASSTALTVEVAILAVAPSCLSLVIDEPDPTCFLDISASKDRRFLFTHSQSKASTEAYILFDQHALKSNAVVTFATRRKNIRYFLEHINGCFHVATNALPSNDNCYNSSDARLNNLQLYQMQLTDDLQLSHVLPIASLHGEKSSCVWNSMWPPSIHPEQCHVADDIASHDRLSVMTDYDLMQAGSVVYGKQQGQSCVHLLSPQSQSNSLNTTGSELSSSQQWSLKDITPGIAAVLRSSSFQIFPGVNSEASARSNFIRFSVSNPLVPKISFSLHLGTGKLTVESQVLAKTEEAKAISDTGHTRINRKEKSFIGDFGRKISKSFRSQLGLGLGLGLDLELESKEIGNMEDCRSLFAIQEHWVPMQTGTSIADNSRCIPISLVGRRGEILAHAPSPSSFPPSKREPRPTLLIGYGAYGSHLPIHYSPEIHELLERGWNVAFAHVRGGGELGVRWHQEGKGLQKRNTFLDFAACATYLIDQGFTAPSMLCGLGGSAGGLLMGVMANNYAHLFAGLILRNPFLDVSSTMRNVDLPLTEHEFEEWGNPIADPACAEYIRSYCPCSAVADTVTAADRKRRVPMVFISTGLQDTRVDPMDTIVFAEKLRGRIKTQRRMNVGLMGGEESVFVSIWKDAGHDGPRVDEDKCYLQAAELMFLITAVQ